MSKVCLVSCQAQSGSTSQHRQISTKKVDPTDLEPKISKKCYFALELTKEGTSSTFDFNKNIKRAFKGLMMNKTCN